MTNNESLIAHKDLSFCGVRNENLNERKNFQKFRKLEFLEIFPKRDSSGRVMEGNARFPRGS
jgi:hypothetical protein